MNPTNLLIDTDLGDDVDDLLALAFALLRPELCVKAITAVSYDTDRRCHLIARLLSSLERTDVAFAPGLRLPLRPAKPQEIENALRPSGYILNQYPIVREEDKRPAPCADAAELIARTVKENAGDLSLVAIGPLTNFAAAICRFPEIVPLVRSLAIMGGELTLNRVEHNINWDAHAAEIVFASGIPLFVGTWDVTRGFVLSPNDCESIKNHPSPLCQLLGEAIDLWWPHKAWKPGPVMYDVAPILWSYAPEYFSTEEMEVKIETRGQHSQGLTIRGWGAPNAQVSTAMQAERVRELYLETLLGS